MIDQSIPSARSLPQRFGLPRESAIGLGVIALTAIIVPWRVLRQPGWWFNDESLFAFERVEGFRRAFKLGNFYPLWSSFAHTGWGSPYPLFYHRLFYTMAAPLSLLFRGDAGDAITHAMKTLIVALLFLGGCGMRRFLRVSGSSEAVAVCGAVLFIVAPYTRSDWFARGAMAEFTAMLLLPWLYAELALLAQGKRRWIISGVLLTLLFHAHSMICLHFLLSTGAFFALTLVIPRFGSMWHGAAKEWPSIAIAVAIVGVGVLPHALVAQQMLPFFNTRIMVDQFPLRDGFEPASRYFLQRWNANDPRTVEVNRYIVAAFALFLLLPGAWRRARVVWTLPLVPFFVSAGVVWSALQLRPLLRIYRYIPQAEYLQFPWRLETFLTVASIFLLAATMRVLLAESAEQRIGVGLLVAVVVLSVATFAPVPAVTPDRLYAPAEISRDVNGLDGPLAGGDFLLNASVAGLDTYVARSGDHLTQKWALLGKHRPFLMQQGCATEPTVVHHLAEGEFELHADEPAPCEIDLRQFQTPMLRLSAKNATLVSPTPALDWVIQLGKGPSVIRLRPRTLWELVGWAWKHPS